MKTLTLKDLKPVSNGDKLLDKLLIQKDQDLMSEGICPKCKSNNTHTEHDFFDYYHSEYIIICDNCGLTAGGW
jgi:transcription elongation factor Elf1